MTVKQRFLDVSRNSEKFWKKSLKVTRQWSEVTRPLNDCQTTFFRRFKRFRKFLKKVTEGHATVVGGHATVVWLSNNVFWRFKQFENFLKKVAERSRDGGRRSRDRWMTVKQRFSDVSSNSEKFWKKSLKVTRQWSEVTRPLDYCQTTFFRRFKRFGKILKKSHWKSRDSGRRSRDRCMTVKQRFFDVPSNSENFCKKSLKVTRQSSEVTRPSADCQTTFFRRFKQFEFFLKKSHWTVTRQWSEVTRPSADCQTHICMNKREIERERETISVTLHTGTAMLCRWPFHQQASRLRPALTRVVDRQGQLVYEYCKSWHWQVEFMLFAICRSTFTRQFSLVLTPGPSSLDFSRESPAKDMGNLFPS